MEPAPLLQDAFSRCREQLHQLLDGLDDEDLTREPHPPIGWLAWRISRIIDSNMSRLAGQDQLWTAEGWHARFGMEPDPRDFGPALSHTRERVRAFRAPSAQLLLDYHDAALERTKGYLAGLTPEDLDRVLDEPQYTPRPTVAIRLVSVLTAIWPSIGQIAYLRGLHRVGGWFPVEDRA